MANWGGVTTRETESLESPEERQRNERKNTKEETEERMKTESSENETWERIVADMRRYGDVGSYGLESYFNKLSLKEDTGTKLIIEYPEDLPIMWVEVNYSDFIINSATRILQGARTLEFRPIQGEQPQSILPEVDAATRSESDSLSQESFLPLDLPEAAAGSKQVEAPLAPKPAQKRSRSTGKVASFNTGLNEDYSFDSFVVGENSEFAFAAAKALVDKPGHLYNPLFIHGASGLGKTHLLQAIGNALRKHDEEAHVLYVTSEDFTNSYIDALSRKGDALSNFRKKYRKADVLLIDDIQFMAQKGKTQDEFFHTFNALFSSGKQIVLTADCPAADVIGMDDRLTSRFEQGLSVTLLPPAYETRMAILRAKSRAWRADLVGDEVLDFLAKNISRSVRRLEGALTRLATFASFSHHSPSVSEARAQLRDFLREETGGRLSIRDIQQRVADEFNLRVADLNGRRRTAGIAHPRQVAMFLARHHTACSLQDIGSAFGGRDHGTVLHAMRTIERKLQDDSDLRASLGRITSSLGI